MSFGVAAGILSAFIANMRTSYLPIAGLFFAAVLHGLSQLITQLSKSHYANFNNVGDGKS